MTNKYCMLKRECKIDEWARDFWPERMRCNVADKLEDTNWEYSGQKDSLKRLITIEINVPIDIKIYVTMYWFRMHLVYIGIYENTCILGYPS